MKGNNNKHLNENQRLKKRNMLLQMKNEIEELEKNIKDAKCANSKNNSIKKLKISLKLIQRLTPYVLTAGILVGGCKFIGIGFPFYSGDKVKLNLNIMKEFDNWENVRYEQQYEDFSNETNVLYYYSQWEYSNDGFYLRKVETYRLKKITEEEVLELFNKKDLKLSDILGEPISIKEEIRNNVTEKELQSKSFLQAVMYSENKNDYIMVNESNSNNVATTALFLILTFFSEIILICVRDSISKFKFSSFLDEIENKYPSINIKELSKKLEIKRNNYDRLMRR